MHSAHRESARFSLQPRLKMSLKLIPQLMLAKEMPLPYFTVWRLQTWFEHSFYNRFHQNEHAKKIQSRWVWTVELMSLRWYAPLNKLMSWGRLVEPLCWVAESTGRLCSGKTCAFHVWLVKYMIQKGPRKVVGLKLVWIVTHKHFRLVYHALVNNGRQ